MRKNIGICTSTNHTKILRDKAIACSHYMGYVLPHFTRKAKSSPKISYNIHFCIAILKFPCRWRMPRMHIWVWLKGTLLYIEWTTLSEIVWLEILVQKTLLQCTTLVSCLDFQFGHSSHSAIADSTTDMNHGPARSSCLNIFELSWGFGFRLAFSAPCYAKPTLTLGSHPDDVSGCHNSLGCSKSRLSYISRGQMNCLYPGSSLCGRHFCGSWIQSLRLLDFPSPWQEAIYGVDWVP